MTIRAVLLDMDGTIFDSGIDFLSIREAVGLARDGRPILAQLEQASEEVRRRALALLHEAEARGAASGVLIPGTEELLELLRAHSGIRTALITNNSRASVAAVLSRYPLRLDLVLSREDGPAKPSPGLFLHALERLGAKPHEAIAIGDTHLDCQAAFEAGLKTTILIGLPQWMRDHLPAGACYEHVGSLLEARDLVGRLIRQQHERRPG